MLDPSFWEDEEVATLTSYERLLLLGCLQYGDDDGRLKAHAAYLKASIFMYDSDIDESAMASIRESTLDKMQGWHHDNIWRLVSYENEGTQYLYFPLWNQHQRPQHPTPSRLPAPPHEPLTNSSRGAHEELMRNSREAHEPLIPRLGEGRGGKVSLVNRIPTGSVAQGDVSKKTKLKPHQQEAGQFLDLVVEHEGVPLLSREKLIHQVRTKLFKDLQSTPQKLFEFYCWLKENDAFFRNKAPPQIIGGMPDRYPSWLAGKLKGGEGEGKKREGVRPRPKQERRRPITRISGHEESPG